MFKYLIKCDNERTLMRIKSRLEYYDKDIYCSRRRLFILTEDIDFPLNMEGATLYKIVDIHEYEHMQDIIEKEYSY